MKWWILFALAACAGGSGGNRIPADPPRPIQISPPAIPAATPGLDETALVQKTHVVEDTADWGQRKTKLVRFVARKN